MYVKGNPQNKYKGDITLSVMFLLYPLNIALVFTPSYVCLIHIPVPEWYLLTALCSNSLSEQIHYAHQSVIGKCCLEVYTSLKYTRLLPVI